MASPEYTVRLYDPTGATLTEIVSLYSEARYHAVRNDVGDFELTVPWRGSAAWNRLRKTCLVEFWRNDVFVFGGMITRRSIAVGPPAMVTVFGRSYLRWLAVRRIRSETGSGPVSSPSDALDDVVKWLVRRDVTNYDATDPTRAVANVATEADLGACPTVDSYAATGFETVLEACQSVAERAPGGLEFDIVRDATSRGLVFRTWVPRRGRDRGLGTASPVLLDVDATNVTGGEYVDDGDAVENFDYGLGLGEGASRYRITDFDAASMLENGRVEAVVDAGGEASAEVIKRVREHLVEKAPAATGLSFSVAAEGQYTFGTDFDLGDRVSARWELVAVDEITDNEDVMDLELTETIGEVTVSLGGGQAAEVQITLGQGGLRTDQPESLGRALGRMFRQQSYAISRVARR